MTTDPNPNTAEHEGRALVVQPPHTTAVELWGTDNPRAMTARMTALADAMSAVVEDRKLYSVIQGNKYVKVEGWSLIGAMIGVFPRTVYSDIIESGHLDELRVQRRDRNGKDYEKVYPEFDGVLTFRARVELVTRDGGHVGGAEAMCSRREEQWRDRDDNQIASMSQTRATAKAYRMTFGFIMPIAGYAPTPAEEMTYIEATVSDAPRPPAERQAPRRAAPAQAPQRAPQGAAQQQGPNGEPWGGGIQNVGQLLTYARDLRAYYGLPVDQPATLAALSVSNIGEVAGKFMDKWMAAAGLVREAVIELASPADPDAQQTRADTAAREVLLQLSPEQQITYDEMVESGVDPQHALLAVGAA